MESDAHRCQVVLLAAGRGTRFGSRAPKQFATLGGRPLFTHAAERLAQLQPTKIVLVTPEGSLELESEEAIETLRRRFPSISLTLIPGGLRRQDSVARGLHALAADTGVILVHDSARPFPPVDGMKELVSRAAEVGGAILAMPVVDTVKQEGPANRIARTLDRTGLWLAQTPQAFRSQFVRSVAHLLEGETELTDEASALEHLDIPVALVPGDSMNFKVTRPEDLRRAEALLQQKAQPE